ncbi:thioesterase [Croceicoccus estronivorus]|uniref:PaaI family thioesterase n=1 Tax=Croceicoccus estronivorus TaxID=1172626 RepID=UPI0008309865|nr:PaaI family thioesterase [Croceicoccus estronivorus]OCC25630.1 thioesterase [Croceicoccus estronivorus]
MTGFNSLLNVTFSGFEEGRYWIELEAGEHHVHEQGFVHGGVILSLLDIAMSRAARHGRPKDAYLPTIELTASFLRPLSPGRVRAWGMIRQQGRSLCRIEGMVLDDKGRSCASGRATFMPQS